MVSAAASREAEADVLTTNSPLAKIVTDSVEQRVVVDCLCKVNKP